jgi:hypothetical protein
VRRRDFIAGLMFAAAIGRAQAQQTGKLYRIALAHPTVPVADQNQASNGKVARAIETTDRRKLIFAGLSLDVCAAFPAITAVNKGLDAYVAVDACGTFSETKRQMGLLRMMQAGVILSDYATLMIEVLKDNGRPEAGAVYGAIDMDWAKLVGQIAQANAN